VKGGKAEPQSIRFDKDKFTAAEARAWLKKHDYSSAGFEPASSPAKAAGSPNLTCQMMDVAKCPRDDCPLKKEGATPAAGTRLVDLAAEGLPALIQGQGAGEVVEIKAEAAGAGGVKLRGFSGTAYTGVAMRLPNYSLPVVVDLEGMRVPRQRLPILRQHDPERIVGHSEAIELTPQRLKPSGLISGTGPAAAEVLALADNNFPWQLSVGAGVDSMEFVDKEARVTINGRSFVGPLYVARKTTLAEISLVPMGGDAATSATVSRA